MNTCHRCERPLPSGQIGGNCPACLLSAALQDDDSDFAGDSPSSVFPQTLGDYELLAEVGRGGAGVVYQARQISLNRVVALKTLQGAGLNRRDGFARLQVESRAIARLDHPNIVPLYEVGAAEGIHYLTLRYFERGSLAEDLKRHRYSPEAAAQFLGVAARAVHYAHSRGVLHRDLKPSNLLLDEAGAPHVADFGLAKLADSDSSLTLSTSVLGTPAYMAPEQATGHAKDAGTPADIYSLGAVLFELLTGRPPFLGSGALEVLRQVADSEPPRPSSLVPGLDRDLEAICLKCLEKDPGQRYTSGAALADDLERWLRQEPLSLRPLSPRERLQKWVRRRPVVAALSAACFLAVALGVLGITWQWQRARQASLNALRGTYLAEMTLANQGLRSGDWAGIRNILQRTIPQPGEPDLRGWEWRYLWKVSRRDPGVELKVGKPIISLALLPDGKSIAVGEKEGGFTLWDIPTATQLYEYPQPINRVPILDSTGNSVGTRVVRIPGTSWLAFTVCLSPTNSYLQLWDTTTRSDLRRLPLPAMPRHLAVSSDGRTLACSTLTTENRNRVLLFDLTSGTLLRTVTSLFSQYSGGSSLAFSPDGELITVEEFPGIVRLVEVRTGVDRMRLVTGQNYLVSAAFSPDGRWLATGSGFDRDEVLVWELPSGRLAHKLEAPNRSLLFDAAGERLLAGATCWAVPSFTLIRPLEGEPGLFHTASLLADGTTYVAPTYSGNLIAWNLAVPPPARTLHTFGMPGLWADFLPHSRGVVFLGTNGMVYEGLAPHYELHPLPELGNGVQSVTVLGAGSLALGHTTGRVTLHDPVGYGLQGQFVTGRDGVSAMEWFGRQGVLCLRTGTNWIQAWNPAQRQLLWEFEVPKWGRRVVKAEAAGVLWLAYTDGSLMGLDVLRGTVQHRRIDQNSLGSLSFSPDGATCLVTSKDGAKWLLDAQSFNTLRTLHQLETTTHHSTFWPDGSRWMFSSFQLVDPPTGRRLLDLSHELGFGFRVVVDPEGNQVLAHHEGKSGTLFSIWRAPTWEEIRRDDPR